MQVLSAICRMVLLCMCSFLIKKIGSTNCKTRWNDYETDSKRLVYTDKNSKHAYQVTYKLAPAIENIEWHIQISSLGKVATGKLCCSQFEPACIPAVERFVINQTMLLCQIDQPKDSRAASK